MSRDPFTGKHIAVLGFGAEGKAAAEFLLRIGADVEVFDAKKESEFAQAEIDAVRKLEEQGVLFHLGEERAIAGFDAVFRSPGMSLDHPWDKRSEGGRYSDYLGHCGFPGALSRNGGGRNRYERQRHDVHAYL
jgi:UDP-N-acetylmuramoylalanine-D-glutamate ligase